MARCPSCLRPVALARGTCLYCGAPLPAGAGSSRPPDPQTPGPAKAPAVEPAAPARSLVVLDPTGTPPERIGAALGVPAYESGLIARASRPQLLRAAPLAVASTEAERLRALGLNVFLIPEAEARIRPIRALGGERSDGVLALRTEEGPVAVRRGELLLVVRGPIARELPLSLKRRRVDTARPDEGYRVHLHRRAEPRPVEIDVGHFEFGFAVTGSGRLELDAWVEEVAGGAPQDDGFRRLPPALGPAEPPPEGALAAAAALSPAPRTGADASAEGPALYDNVEQFRFYSGWRAAVERRR